MTITVNGKVSAPEGLELEVIEAHAGVEQHRFRAASGRDVSLTVFGSKTLILREVATAAGLEPKPGEQRHGTLDVPNTAKHGLEEGDADLLTNVAGDVDPLLNQLLTTADEARDRVIELAEKLIDLDGDESQKQVYGELREAVKMNIDAGERLEEYMSAQA